jgi:hypothetical protein
MVDKFTTIIKDEKGQALFELVIFLPFLLFLYMIYSTAGDSISASINQQKAVRGYFYSLVRGNSYINSLVDLEEFDKNNVKLVGFSALGWREKSDKGGNNAFAPCFKFSSLLKNDSTEECDAPTRDQDSDGNGVSRFIRVFTFYGVCGPVYSATNVNGRPYFEIIPAAQTDPRKCALGASPLNN